MMGRRDLVPRFVPWLLDATEELVAASPQLPHGLPVLLPCCGPGHEAPLLQRCLPAAGAHAIHASDLAQGMVQLAQQVAEAAQAGDLALQEHRRLKGDLPREAAAAVLQSAAQRPALAAAMADTVSSGSSNLAAIHVQQLDACALAQAAGEAQAAAVLSVFGLQQLGPLAPHVSVRKVNKELLGRLCEGLSISSSLATATPRRL